VLQKVLYLGRST